jgi:glycosyltransferase involved in cell wall biosynthesis
MTLVVAQVIDDLTQGGAQTLVRNLVARAPPTVEHHVFALGSDDTLRADFQSVAASVTVCNGAFRFDPRALARLLRGLASSDADVVHTHLPYAQAFGRLCGVLARVGPVVSTYHDVPQSFCPDPHMLAVEVATRPLDTATVGVSGGVVTEFERGLYLGRFGDMIPIPNGVDVSGIRDRVATADGDTVRSSLGVADETLVLNVGRLARKKRQVDLVAATRQLRDRNEAVHLVLVGSGDEERAIRQRVSAEGIEDAVTVTGRVPAVEPYYAAADVYAHAALYEGFGLTIVEAMAAGLPVVATDVPGARDVLGDAGPLVPPESPADLAHALATCLDSERRSTLAKRSRARAVQFDIARTERAYRGLYRLLVG